MFSFSGIEIKVPDLSNLPENVEMHSLFDGCSGLTGDMPDLSVLKQTDLRYLFRDCSGITGEIKALPENLENAWGMFENCYGLTGDAPKKPETLIEYYNRMFGGTKITPTEDWPDDAF